MSKLNFHRVTLTFVVTSTFDLRFRKIDNVTSRYEAHLSTKYEVDPSIGLGGVRGHTYTHTHIQRALRYYNIDYTFGWIYIIFLCILTTQCCIPYNAHCNNEYSKMCMAE